MSEPSFLQASQDTDEVFTAVGHKAQTMTSLITELATSWSYRSAERSRMLQAEAEAADRAHRDRLKAQRDGDMPLMRQVWDTRWWEQATADQIGLAWETTGGWARNDDPYARRTQQRLREQISQRFGVDLDDEPVTSTLLAKVLAGSPTERPVSFVIRDNNGADIQRGTLTLTADDRRPLNVIAADQLHEFSTARRTAADPTGRYSIEAYDASLPGGQRRSLISDDQAATVRQDYTDWARRVLAGAEPAPLDRVREVYLVERQRLRRQLRELQESDPRVVAARAAYTDEVAIRRGLDPRTPRPRPDPPMGADDHAAKVAALTEQLDGLQLRLDKVTADLNGEDVDLVTAAAILRRDLDPQWWQTAAPEEVAGIWTHVDNWTDGAATRAMRTDLHTKILRHYDLDITPGVSFEHLCHQLQRADADRHGERLVRFRIQPPQQASQAADTGAPPTATVQASGTLRVPKNEPLAQTAQRQLRTYAGDLDTARTARLVITFSEYGGAPLGTFDAAGLLDEGNGTAATDHGTPSGARDGTNPLARPPRPRTKASGQPSADAQDLADAHTLQRMADTDPATARAVDAARRARKAWPPHEPPASGGARRSRRGTNGTNGLGERGPRTGPGVHPRNRPEQGR